MGMGFFSGNGTFRTPVRSVKRPVLENRVKVIWLIEREIMNVIEIYALWV